MANVTVELRWLSNLLHELSLHITSVPHIWCDNLGAVFISSNAAFTAQTRHVEVDFHFVREQIVARALSVGSISTKDQLADVMTNPLSKPAFNFIVYKLRLTNT